jgi:hypothetical protein
MEVFPLKIRKVAMLGLLISASFVSGAFAASNLEKVEAYLRKDFQVFVNGTKADVGPVLVYENTSYLPVAKLGRLLGAEVNWNAGNQGIYINPKLYQQTDPTDDANTSYSTITMYQPQGFNITYLGKQVPVLAVYTTDYTTTYYRVSDLKNLQIDLGGLSLAKEMRTEELYVSDKELAKVWKEKPQIDYVYDKLITGNPDKDQLKVVVDYLDMLPAMYKALNYKDPNYPDMDYYTVPIIYAIDALPNNEFKILGSENGRFKQYSLKLKQNILEQWYRSEEKILDLGTYDSLY